jgi:homocysteine S-methyltransferase
MNPIEQIIKDFPVLILDGAMATELEGHGCDLKDSLWSAKVLLENPELIKQVHMDYFEAGADCTITASYQATVEGFALRGLSEQEAIALIQRSVRIAIEARDEFWTKHADQVKGRRPKPLVAASVGPYGAYLADGSEYRGNYALNEDELVEFHRTRLQALIEAGADVLACETIPCLVEAKAIIRLLKEFPGVYAWFSFSARDGLHISDGTAVTECAQWLDGHDQAAAVGINCTAPEHIPSLIHQIRSYTRKPIVVYPNSGESFDAKEKVWHSAAPGEGYCSSSQQWHEAGAQLIGGCCRTTPADIRAIATWARK